jgi:hypothetical protein
MNFLQRMHNSTKLVLTCNFRYKDNNSALFMVLVFLLPISFYGQESYAIKDVWETLL